ncbi:MAG: kelch repeat-containing protein [Kofleriaceae bacterium]
MARAFASLGLVASLALVGLGACDSSTHRPDAPSSAWSVTTMPRKALEPGVAALGQQVVVLGGFDTGARDGLDITARTDVFDVAEGTWSQLPDAPVRWTHINLAVVGTTLYLVGGLEGSQFVARGESFALDPIARSWGTRAAMPPGDERGAAGVVTAAGRIYLLGGASTTDALATCLEYDIVADTWSALPDLPAPRSHPAAMRMTDGTLIVAGGLETLDSSRPRGEVWALSPPGAANRVWQARTPVPSDLRGGCAYGVVLGELVCAGGESGIDARNVVQSYDPYLDQWTPREAMPADRAGTQGASVGARLFIPGGAQRLVFEPTDTLYIYTPLDTAP